MINQDDAGKISSWLGIKGVTDGGDFWLSWLASPEGEIAMMDKLHDKNIMVEISSIGGKLYPPKGSLWVTVKITSFAKGVTGEEVAPTRNEALQLAILETIKDD